MKKSLLRFVVFIGLLTLVLFGKKWFMQPKYDNGELAPPFETTLVDGRSFSLSNLKGSYVLLDFWGTWCGPCRVEFPKLKALHKKYYNQKIENADNFHIVGIALEREGDLERTKRAIDKLGLNWDYHIFDPISNFKIFNAKIATELYGVREVPTWYLIDPKGMIVGVNMPFEEIEKVLQGQ